MTHTPADLEDGTRAFWSAEVRRHVLVHPDEAVIRFLAGMAPDRASNAGKAALDVGCGSGRHMRLLAEYGFAPCGVDFSRDALDVAAEALSGLDVRLIHGPVKQIDAAVERFHCLLGYGTFMYRPLTQTAKDLVRCFDLLEPGGSALVNFRPTDNWFHGLGEPQGDGFWRLDERAGPFAGSSYLFVDAELSEQMATTAGFEVVNTERIELWKNKRMERNVWDVYWLRRPS